MSPRRSHGFTLVEIFIALAIVGILMMLVGPSMGTWIQNTRLRSAAEAIARGLQTARVEAMKRNAVVAFNLTDAASSAFTVCLYDAVNNACFAGTSNILMQRDANEDAATAKVGTDTAMSDPTTALAVGANVPASAAFDSYGRLASTAPNNIMRVDVRNPIVKAADERRLVIFINTSGQIRVCDPKLAKSANPQGCQ